MKQRYTSLLIIVIISVLFVGWGGVGHKIVSKNTVLSFPQELSFLTNWPDSLAAHSSDADNRKNNDPDEAPKHYIDIDSYPEFLSTGMISQDYDSVVLQHGSAFVIDQGILPWAIIAAYDSLTNCFKHGDMHKAMLFASDLGHYIGDGHMPLHIATNYNGQLTGQTGIHSRYESTMIGKYSTQIVYPGDSVELITNIKDFVFERIYRNHYYKDSLLAADLYAKGIAGNTTSNTYYLELWNKTKNFTIKMMQDASYSLTCLIYTAWKTSQQPVSVNSEKSSSTLNTFTIKQNYPNPFNPSTKISYTLPEAGKVSIKIFDTNGKEISELMNKEETSGNHEITFSGKELTSGVYFYRVTYNNKSLTGKMILTK